MNKLSSNQNKSRSRISCLTRRERVCETRDATAADLRSLPNLEQVKDCDNDVRGTEESAQWFSPLIGTRLFFRAIL